MGKKQNLGGVVFPILNYTFFVLFTLITIYPFYYLIINSISATDLSARGGVIFIPHGIQFANYSMIFKIPGLTRALYISFARTVAGTILPVFASGLVGFLFSKEKMWGRKFWYRYVVITMYFNAGFIPMFLTILKFNLYDRFLVYVIPSIVQPFNIILVKTYVESTPISLQESAEIDGAGIMTVFIQIMLPLITPILATIAIFAAVGQWNSFYDTVVYIRRPDLHTLQYKLYQYVTGKTAELLRNLQQGMPIDASMAQRQTPMSVRTTITVLVTLPVLFIYPFFQRYFVKGLMVGAIKG